MHFKVPMASAELDQRDSDAVLEVLRSGRLALGPKTREFEALVAAYTGVKHGIAVNSGTSALHILIRALGLGPGDQILVPSFTFAASVNAALYEGVTPVFVDIEPDTFNLDPDDLARKITPQTKAIMVVDVFGHPADWRPIQALADEHRLRIIDDACEALGAEYEGRKLGQFGDCATFAFYPNKQITTGEGGLIVTDDDEIARMARSLRNQGRGEMGAWLEHERLGFNFRMDEMSAALGVSQFKRLETFLEKRARVAARYSEKLAVFDWLVTPTVRPNVRMSWFVYVVMLAEGLQRDPLIKALEELGVPSRGYFAPIHTQPYIRKRFGDWEGALPVTEAIAQRTVALPFHNNLSDQDIDLVVDALAKAGRALEFG